MPRAKKPQRRSAPAKHPRAKIMAKAVTVMAKVCTAAAPSTTTTTTSTDTAATTASDQHLDDRAQVLHQARQVFAQYVHPDYFNLFGSFAALSAHLDGIVGITLFQRLPKDHIERYAADIFNLYEPFRHQHLPDLYLTHLRRHSAPLCNSDDHDLYLSLEAEYSDFLARCPGGHTARMHLIAQSYSQ